MTTLTPTRTGVGALGNAPPPRDPVKPEPGRVCTRYGGRRCSGFSLLEVVLSLAIAAIAMALLAQLVGTANRSAAASRDLTKAQLIAKAVIAEFASGVMLPQSTSGTWEFDPMWTYDAQVSPGASENLSVITVTVTQAVEDLNPTTFSLTQFLFIPPEPEEETETSTESVDLGGGA